MTPVWQTTVDTLLRSFLDALNALVPTMQTARILDQTLVGYDDWARVTDVLYRVMVVEPIRASLNDFSSTRFDLPMYDTEYESYEDFSLIRVTRKGDSLPVDIKNDCFLMRFLPSDNQANKFTHVETFQLGSGTTLLETSYANQPIDDVYFTVVVPDGESWKVLDTITVRME